MAARLPIITAYRATPRRVVLDVEEPIRTPRVIPTKHLESLRKKIDAIKVLMCQLP